MTLLGVLMNFTYTLLILVIFKNMQSKTKKINGVNLNHLHQKYYATDSKHPALDRYPASALGEEST